MRNFYYQLTANNQPMAGSSPLTRHLQDIHTNTPHSGQKPSTVIDTDDLDTFGTMVLRFVYDEYRALFLKEKRNFEGLADKLIVKLLEDARDLIALEKGTHPDLDKLFDMSVSPQNPNFLISAALDVKFLSDQRRLPNQLLSQPLNATDYAEDIKAYLASPLFSLDVVDAVRVFTFGTHWAVRETQNPGNRYQVSGANRAFDKAFDPIIKCVDNSHCMAAYSPFSQADGTARYASLIAGVDDPENLTVKYFEWANRSFLKEWVATAKPIALSTPRPLQGPAPVVAQPAQPHVSIIPQRFPGPPGSPPPKYPTRMP